MYVVWLDWLLIMGQTFNCLIVDNAGVFVCLFLLIAGNLLRNYELNCPRQLSLTPFPVL